MVGQTLLHYEIIEKIGEGGMGAVYRAQDTHLDRPVAIKVLITEDARDLSRPDWSPNGRYLYFISQKNDRWSIYAQELDSRTKEPAGEAHEVYFSPESKFRLNFPIGNGEIAVASDKIIFYGCEITGNIYLVRPKAR